MAPALPFFLFDSGDGDGGAGLALALVPSLHSIYRLKMRPHTSQVRRWGEMKGGGKGTASRTGNILGVDDMGLPFSATCEEGIMRLNCRGTTRVPEEPWRNPGGNPGGSTRIDPEGRRTTDNELYAVYNVIDLAYLKQHLPRITPTTTYMLGDKDERVQTLEMGCDLDMPCSGRRSVCVTLERISLSYESACI